MQPTDILVSSVKNPESDFFEKAVIIINADGIIKEFNRTALQLLGNPPCNNISDTRYSFITKSGDSIPKEELPWFKAFIVKKDIKKSLVGLCIDGGKPLWLTVTARLLYNNLGEITGTSCSFRAPNVFIDSELKYRTFFENLTEEIHVWKLVKDGSGTIITWRLIDVNPPALKTWNTSSVEELRGKTADEIFGAGTTEHYMPVVQKIYLDGLPYSYEDYFPKLDKHFRFTSIPLGEYFITTGSDITEILKLQQKSERQFAELKAVFDSTHDSILIYNMEGDVVMANSVFMQINRIKSIKDINSEYLRSAFEIYKPDGELLPFNEWPARKALSGERVENEVYKVVRKDIDIEVFLSFNASPVFDETGKQILAMTLTRDVTTQKLAEIAKQGLLEKYKESQSNFLRAEEMAHIGSFSYDLRSGIIQGSDEFWKIFGMPNVNGINSWNNLTELIHQEDLKRIKNSIEINNPGKPLETDLRIYTHDGQLKYVHLYDATEADENGVIIKRYGAVIDITQRKKAEIELKETLIRLKESEAKYKSLVNEQKQLLEALRENELKFRKSEELAKIGSWIYDFETGLMECSDEFCRIFNLEEGKKYTTNEILEKVDSPDNKLIREKRMKIVRLDVTDTEEFIVKNPDGSFRYIYVYDSPVLDASGKVIKRVGSVLDITDRKVAEKNLDKALNKLRESEAKLIEAQRAARMGMVEWDLVNYKITWSDSMYDIFERDRKLGNPTVEETREYMHPADREKIRLILENATSDALETEFRIVLPGNRIKYLAYYVKTLFDESGKQVKRLGSLPDITERKIAALQLEDALMKLKSSETKLLNAQKMAKMGNVEIDLNTMQLNWSDEVFDIYELPRGEGHPDFDQVMKYIHPGDKGRILQIINGIKKSEVIQIDYRIITPGNKIKYVVYYMTPIFENGVQVKRIGTIQDITEFKLMQVELQQTLEQLQKEIAEKEVLLRELYHRTKNNMQIISSLLNLKAGSIADSRDREVFLEMRNRIQAMSLVHEKLYQSKSLSRLNLGRYIRELTDLLIISHEETRGKLKVFYELADIEVLIDTAIPCGFIITELVLNIIKYAFPGDMQGIMSIKLITGKEGTFNLIIQDNGIGIKENGLYNEDKLGLQLVKSLVEDQLNGTLRLDTSLGTCWQISFKEDLYTERV